MAQWVKEIHDGYAGRHGLNGPSTGSSRSTYPEIANASLVLIAVACSLLDRQLASQAEVFEKEADSPNASINGGTGTEEAMSGLAETTLERTALDWFESLGWQVAFGPDGGEAEQ